MKIPTGPSVEILRAWHGKLAYEPALVQAPVAIIRGSWDSLIPDEDARWLFEAFSRSPTKRDIKIGGGTHLMHLEAMRLALWRESVGFLLGEDKAPVPPYRVKAAPGVSGRYAAFLFQRLALLAGTEASAL